MIKEPETYLITTKKPVKREVIKLNWKTLTKISDPVTASLIKGRLLVEGIPTIIRAGEAAGSLYGLTTGPLAEIKILVPSDRLTEALILLQHIEDEQEQESYKEFDEDLE